MAPELFSENADGYDGAAVDIWALGATLYTLVVGRPPFMAENEFELVRLVQTQPLRFPSDVLVDAHLQYVVTSSTVDMNSRCWRTETFCSECCVSHPQSAALWSKS